MKGRYLSLKEGKVDSTESIYKQQLRKVWNTRCRSYKIYKLSKFYRIESWIMSAFKTRSKTFYGVLNWLNIVELCRVAKYQVVVQYLKSFFSPSRMASTNRVTILAVIPRPKTNEIEKVLWHNPKNLRAKLKIHPKQIKPKNNYQNNNIIPPFKWMNRKKVFSKHLGEGKMVLNMT